MDHLTFYVRTSLNPDQLFPSIKKLMAHIDPNLPVEDLRTMPQQMRESIFTDRIIDILSAAFACLATLLAAVGLYGVLAYTVAQRTREIGLRIALGASQAQVRAMVLRQVGIITLIGSAIGLGFAIGIRPHSAVDAISAPGIRSCRALRLNGCSGAGCAGCRLHSGVSRRAHRSDGCAPVRVSREPRRPAGIL